MANISAVIAVATAVANYDCFKDEPEARQSYARKINMLGVVGSAALGDFTVELIVGGVKQGKYSNTTAGVSASNAGSCLINRDLKEVDIYVPANAQVQAICVGAATTNAVRVEAHFTRPAFTGRRTGNRRTYSNRSGGTRRTGVRRMPSGGFI